VKNQSDTNAPKIAAMMHRVMPLVSRPTTTPALTLDGLGMLPLLEGVLEVVGRMLLEKVPLGPTIVPPVVPLPPVPLVVPLMEPPVGPLVRDKLPLQAVFHSAMDCWA